ncbi:MAG: restriction endonuclease [Nitrososphaerota archaeon]
MQVRPDIASKVLEAVLKLSASNAPINVDEISRLSLISKDEARRILSLLEVGEGDRLEEDERVRAILSALRLGVDASLLAKHLDWKEFEKLITALLGEAGYEAEWDVKLTHEGGRIQVDVLAYGGSMLLIIDCKRWNRSLTPSVERRIMERQERRMLFLRNIIERTFHGEDLKTVYLIPVTLSLYRPSKPIIDGFIFASLDKLRGALEYAERSFFQLRNERVAIPRDIALKQIVRKLREGSRPRTR